MGNKVDQLTSHNEHQHGHSHDHGHDHSHHHHPDHVHADGEVEVLRLVLEDDTELECYVLGIFEVREKEYIALLPKDEDEVLLYEYQEDEEGMQLLGIDDDEVYELVAKVFNQAQEEGAFDTCEAD